jgi:hypothetical protein
LLRKILRFSTRGKYHQQSVTKQQIWLFIWSKISKPKLFKQAQKRPGPDVLISGLKMIDIFSLDSIPSLCFAVFSATIGDESPTFLIKRSAIF